MQSVNNINNTITVRINGEPLSFNPEIDVKRFVVEPGHIDISVFIPDTLDQTGISISIGDDVGFKGFNVRLQPVSGTAYYTANREDIDSICGMRLFGRSSFNILYLGTPVIGCSTFVDFRPSKAIERYVEIMRQDFEKDIQAVIDLYGLTKEEFELQDFDDDSWDPSFLRFMLVIQLYKEAYAFLNSKADQLESNIIATKDPSWIVIQNARGIRSHQILDAYSAGEPFAYIPIGSIRYLPSKVPVKNNEISFDTSNNQRVLSVLFCIEREIASFYDIFCYEYDQLREAYDVRYLSGGSFTAFVNYKLGRLQRARKVCSDFLKDVRAAKRLLKQLGVQYKPVPFSKGTPILKNSYRMLLNGYQKFQSQIRLIRDGGNPWATRCSFQTRSVNYLYELWVAQLILNIFKDLLEFIPEDRNLLKYGSIISRLNSGKPIELVRREDSRRIKFYYGRKFPRFDNPFCMDEIGVIPRVIAGETRAIAKDNPDICIEFYDEEASIPKIVIFDTTFSNNPNIHKEKGYYKQLIWYRPYFDAPQMQWKRIVVDSIAIHPYKPIDNLPVEGEWSLIPGEEIEAAGRWLSDLLQFHSLS